MEINSILQVIPAVLGYTISGLTISYFVFPGILSYLIRKQEQWGFIVSSFLFIISGFLFQIYFYNFSGIKDFASEYHDIFSIPIFTILATVISTTLGIFLGNTILRYIDKRKEQKEIAIIFINAIDAQVKCMRHINFYLSSLRQDDPKSDEFLKIYISELSDYKGFETTFERIGIYSEREIDCISLYSTKRKQLISLTERLLLHFANPEKKKNFG